MIWDSKMIVILLLALNDILVRSILKCEVFWSDISKTAEQEVPLFIPSKGKNNVIVIMRKSTFG